MREIRNENLNFGRRMWIFVLSIKRNEAKKRKKKFLRFKWIDGWIRSRWKKCKFALFEIYLRVFSFIFRARKHRPFWLLSLNISFSKANVSETLSQHFYDRIDHTRKYLYLIVILIFRSWFLFRIEISGNRENKEYWIHLHIYLISILYDGER